MDLISTYQQRKLRNEREKVQEVDGDDDISLYVWRFASERWHNGEVQRTQRAPLLFMLSRFSHESRKPTEAPEPAVGADMSADEVAEEIVVRMARLSSVCPVVVRNSLLGNPYWLCLLHVVNVFPAPDSSPCLDRYIASVCSGQCSAPWFCRVHLGDGA